MRNFNPPSWLPDSPRALALHLAWIAPLAVLAGGLLCFGSGLLFRAGMPDAPPTGEAAQLSDPTAQSPASTPSGLRLISREAWGAQPFNPNAWGESGAFDPVSNPSGVLVYPEPLSDWLRTIVIHHSALPLSDGPQEIQALHQGERGYADVAYHFMIGYDGALYAGRPLNMRGAHVARYNTGSIGVMLVGNMNELEPSPAQLATLNALIDELTAQFPLTHLAGHQDFPGQDTECPGANLHVLLPDLAAAHGLAYGIQGYTEPPWAQTP